MVSNNTLGYLRSGTFWQSAFITVIHKLRRQSCPWGGRQAGEVIQADVQLLELPQLRDLRRQVAQLHARQGEDLATGHPWRLLRTM